MGEWQEVNFGRKANDRILGITFYRPLDDNKNDDGAKLNGNIFR
jgi:hypothetical protein